MVRWDDTKVQHAVGSVLRFGVLTAVYAIFAGFLLAGAAVIAMLAARRMTRRA